MEAPIFEPTVLRWAREKRFGPKIEVLQENWADSWADITPDLIGKWEHGSAQPTFEQVRILARIYKRPLAAFFLDSPPPERGTPPDLRTIGSTDNDFLSPAALLVIRKARRVQEISAALAEELGERITFKYSRYSLDDNPSKLAGAIRAELSISFREQAAFRTYEDFFEDLRSKIERKGVITLKSGLQDSFPVADCRAFSFTDQQPFLILVNNADTEGAKNFSLAHEFAHLLLRESGICNNFQMFDGSTKAINRVEVFCNKFAAAFLVPEDIFMEHARIKNGQALSSSDLDALGRELALKFKVSRVVILRRFLTFGLITQPTYTSKIRDWESEDRPRRQKGGRFSVRTTFRKNGKAFSTLVLDAYKQQKISYVGVSDFLGLRIKHLPKFEQLISSNAR